MPKRRKGTGPKNMKPLFSDSPPKPKRPYTFKTREAYERHMYFLMTGKRLPRF